MSEKDFINKWVKSLREGGLKKFPDDFMIDGNTEIIELPAKTLVLGPELFGTWEIEDTSGNKMLQAKNIISAKYILYSNRLFPEKIEMPKTDSESTVMVKAYEKYLDGLVIEIIKDFRSTFPEKKNFFEVSNVIFNSLSLCRY